MTIGEVLSEFRTAVPFGADDAILIKWLSEIEGVLVSEIILTHEETPEGADSFDGYKYNESRDRHLFADDPFCHLYVEYLAMKFYITAGDVQRYNTFAELFYNSYGNFADYYNRKKKPKSLTAKFSTKEAKI